MWKVLNQLPACPQSAQVKAAFSAGPWPLSMAFLPHPGPCPCSCRDMLSSAPPDLRLHPEGSIPNAKGISVDWEVG